MSDSIFEAYVAMTEAKNVVDPSTGGTYIRNIHVRKLEEPGWRARTQHFGNHHANPDYEIHEVNLGYDRHANNTYYHFQSKSNPKNVKVFGGSYSKEVDASQPAHKAVVSIMHKHNQGFSGMSVEEHMAHGMDMATKASAAHAIGDHHGHSEFAKEASDHFAEAAKKSVVGLV